MTTRRSSAVSRRPARVLPNGAVVIAKQSPTTPAVTIHASIRAGSDSIRRTQAVWRTSSRRTIDRGTTARTADRIAEELENRGVSLSVTVNRHAMWLVCTCLVEDLEPILALLADIVMQPTFPERRSRDEARRDRHAHPPGRGQPGDDGGGGAAADLYGATHPYGRRPRGTVESVEQIDDAALQRFHGERFRPASLSLVLVGDVEPERAIDAADARVRRLDWHRRRPPSSLREAPSAPGAPSAGHPDDEQGAGRHRLRVHQPASRRIPRTTRTG